VLILFIILILLIGVPGTWYGHQNYGPAWGSGIGLGTVLIIILLFYLLGGIR